ncbi:hypothetical protein CDV31_002652 [Fusarium ambrosium]|uniref:Sulfatase N-terminal domain-containing protein n=1 Tax=Fusarium ambrosium TaxID=131363 RepID=A0A428UW93_9HYPO|nr:hypothetical protein CDV31_002652 [Fusarium ambrosium]
MADKRPNVLIILADDLGFSDVGAFGGEIETPNIDRVAAEGLGLTDFHAASACSPTRAMLLSGTDHHVAGIGSMAERITPDIAGKPGYEGYLNDRVVSMQELLRDAGYETLMSGKWHLGLTPDRVPAARGFERSFSLLKGAHNHYGWEPAYTDKSTVPNIVKVLGTMYYDDQKPVAPDELPDGFYSSDSFTDVLLGYLRDREEKKEQRPFFAYLPFSAPHWPLQAPMESIAKYKGMYDDGPEALRQRRLASLKKKGLVPQDAVPAPVISIDENGADTPAWEDMNPEQRAASARRMEAYAGMVDRMDWNIGRVLDYLQSVNQLDDTVVMFLSDNGAEGAMFEAWPVTAGGDMDEYVAKWHNNSIENIGARDSFAWYGARWASASTAPGLLYKMFTSEGGIRVPFAMRYPRLERSSAGDVGRCFATVMDIMPTVLDLCSVKHPGEKYKGRAVAPLAGRSWRTFLEGKAEDVHPHDHVMGWELFGRRAVRRGGFKALFIPKPYGPDRWQLFNVLDDQGETRDLAGEMPELLAEMVELYGEYCARNGVVTRSGNSRNEWSK